MLQSLRSAAQPSAYGTEGAAGDGFEPEHLTSLHVAVQLLDKARGVAARLEATRAQRDALTSLKSRPANDGMVATMQAAVAARERELQVPVLACLHNPLPAAAPRCICQSSMGTCQTAAGIPAVFDEHRCWLHLTPPTLTCEWPYMLFHNSSMLRCRTCGQRRRACSRRRRRLCRACARGRQR